MSRFMKNAGQWHPGIAWLATIDADLEPMYRGSGRVAIAIAATGEIEDFEYLDAWNKPGPGRVERTDWESDDFIGYRWFALADGRPLPEEGPCNDGQMAIVYGVASDMELMIERGTAGAALLNVIQAPPGQEIRK